MTTGLVFSLTALLGDSVTSLIILDLIFWRYYRPCPSPATVQYALPRIVRINISNMSNFEQIATYLPGILPLTVTAYLRT